MGSTNLPTTLGSEESSSFLDARRGSSRGIGCTAPSFAGSAAQSGSHEAMI